MNDFFAEFLDDYFAETEEHLTRIQQILLELENWLNHPQLDPSLIHELFRSFHTIKGLSGMVGVKEAEELSHNMESYLRRLRDEKLILISEGFDSLIQGTKCLEEVIHAYQTQSAIPDVTNINQRLGNLLEEHLSPPLETNILVPPIQLKLKPEEQTRVQEEYQLGKKLWHFTFTSSPELAKAGLNVTIIRNQLEQKGTLLYVAPRLKAQGDICFDFLVSLEAEENIFLDLENKGLVWTPFIPNLPDNSSSEIDQSSHNSSQNIDILPPENNKNLVSETTLKNQKKNQESEENIIYLEEKGLNNHNNFPLSPVNIMNANSTVRVDLPKLDDLMRMVGDLVISRAKLETSISILKEHLPSNKLRALQEVNLTLERQLRDLREGIMRLRLVPIGETFARMQFVVRDVVRESGKQVTLELLGQDTEIDKFVVERMFDPLLHLVRNAVSHGIETPEERIAKGKSSIAKITLRSKTAGEIVMIEIEDDGRGVDVEKVIQKGREKGLLHDILKTSDADLNSVLEIICNPGFSTKETTDLVSGRGVGMAIVKNTVQELGGLIQLKTKKDQGTCFQIQLPLTLAIIDALIVEVNQQIYAIPQAGIQEVMEVSEELITPFENCEMITYRESILPLLRLQKAFNLEIKDYSVVMNNFKIVVVGSGNHLIGIQVDRTLGLREIVVRPLTDPLVQVSGIAGATELGDGRIVLILDISSLRTLSLQLAMDHGS